MKILKFGGSSVADAERIRKVAEIIRGKTGDGEEVAVVISAMGGVTGSLLKVCESVASSANDSESIIREIEDKHLGAARALLPVEKQPRVLAEIMSLCNELSDIARGASMLAEVTPRTSDLILSFGERLSASLLCEVLRLQFPDALFVDARDIIKTNSDFGKARVDFESSSRLIREFFLQNQGLKVITGFIASDSRGQTTTLGRSGSDYTATIIAAAVDASSVEIWSDADGVMTADPALVPEARSIEMLSYPEAMELSHFGAKILFPLSLYPAMMKKIPVFVRNTFNPSHPGTCISAGSAKGNGIIRGITSLRNISLINVEGSGMVGVAGISSRMFGSLSQNNINIILISQASSEQSICVAVKKEDSSEAIRLLKETFSNELSAGLISSVYGEDDLAIVAVVGENMRHVPGVAAKVFTPLGRNGINIKAISQGSSELNISFVVNENDLRKALRVLHQALFSSEIRRLNIFMAGTGSIGGRLLGMIHEQEKSLLSRRIELRICGLINTRKMIVCENGIDTGKWKTELESNSLQADFGKFSESIVSGRFENSVFIDATASDQPVQYYSGLLSSNVSIVAANKRANTGTLELFRNLQNSARKKNVSFNYETNVGAGLPVINVIRNLIAGGDEIIRIEAVLSGTVNWLLSEYDGTVPFFELVREAMKRGYTEPYPGDDLLGVDVARKILLLARESGFMLEQQEVQTEPVLPGGVPDGIDTDSLLSLIRSREGDFQHLYREAEARGMKLKYVASTEAGSASVKMTSTGVTHPFYTLKGSENCLIFTTKYYNQYPLVIKGPGAGVDVTSAGLLADIVRIAESVRV